MLKYYHDRYKNKQMCGKAVHTFLPTLKFVSNWFDTNKMLKILAGVVLSNNDKSLLMKIPVMSDFLVNGS